MALTIGDVKIHGDQSGETKDSSKSKEEFAEWEMLELRQLSDYSI